MRSRNYDRNYVSVFSPEAAVGELSPSHPSLRLGGLPGLRLFGLRTREWSMNALQHSPVVAVHCQSSSVVSIGQNPAANLSKTSKKKCVPICSSHQSFHPSTVVVNELQEASSVARLIEGLSRNLYLIHKADNQPCPVTVRLGRDRIDSPV